jgi:hypothetical protein
MNKLSLIIIFAALLASCEKDTLFRWEEDRRVDADNRFVYSPSPVFDVIGPSSMKLGESVSIQVRSQGNSGCAGFSHFRKSASGRNTINIQAIQRVPRGAICTMALTTLNSGYEFKPESRGKHTLNFWRGELHEYDFVTIEINVR